MPLVMFGFEGKEASPHALDWARRGAAGAILFSRNVESPQQVAQLVRVLKEAAAPRPFLVAVDQEGGRVQRLRAPWTEWPPMRRVGETGEAALAEAVGAALGREVRAAGFDLDFAPVVDVDTNPQNPVIGDRAFSREPARVAEMGAALVRGLQGAGVAACAKHFPGHGDTAQDSHLELPRLPHGLERLRAVELPPFHAAVEAGVACVMTAHVVFEAVDADFPATLSPRALAVLREELGYPGVIVSDDLEMKAVAGRWSTEDAAQRAVEAGCDLLLACKTPEVVERAAAGASRASPERIRDAQARVQALAARWAAPATAVDPELAARLAGPPEHRALAERVRSGVVVV
jgi:beta-N-acetylhexosaminidase